jgi:hypothetical protein
MAQYQACSGLHISDFNNKRVAIMHDVVKEVERTLPTAERAVRNLTVVLIGMTGAENQQLSYVLYSRFYDV